MGKVERRGIEPRLPGCKPSVFPLDQRPVSFLEVRPGIEPGPRPYHRRVQPKHLQTIFYVVAHHGLVPYHCSTSQPLQHPNSKSDPGWSRTIAFLVVIQAS